MAVKSGQSGNQGSVEQYDAVDPVPGFVSEAVVGYVKGHWKRLRLPDDGPLFPGEDIKRPVSAETLHSWWTRAELALAKRGKTLDLSAGNAWHGFRAARRAELRVTHDKYVRFLVGHSIRTGKPGISVSEGRYFGIVPADLVAAIETAGPIERAFEPVARAV